MLPTPLEDDVPAFTVGGVFDADLSILDLPAGLFGCVVGVVAFGAFGARGLPGKDADLGVDEAEALAAVYVSDQSLSVYKKWAGR